MIKPLSDRLKGRAPVAVLTALCLIVALLSGCISGPPVQEMSDARQAIAVAKEAGASELASAELKAAEDFLDSAQRKLTEKRYTQARMDALQAKNKALEALAGAERGSQPRE